MTWLPQPPNMSSSTNTAENSGVNFDEQTVVDNSAADGVYIFKTYRFIRIPQSKARVLNDEVARIEYHSKEDIDDDRPEGLYLVAQNGYMFRKSHFESRIVGNHTIIWPTTKGAAEPRFMALFNSFHEYVEVETKKTNRQREYVYNQMLAMFFTDKDKYLEGHTGLSKGKNLKQIATTKIPDRAADAIISK